MNLQLILQTACLLLNCFQIGLLLGLVMVGGLNTLDLDRLETDTTSDWRHARQSVYRL